MRRDERTRFHAGNQMAVGKGRPRKDAVIAEFFEETIKGKTIDGEPFAVERRQALLERLYTSAMDVKRRDHPKLLELAMGYYFGKPRERLEMSGPGGTPITTADATGGRRPTTGEMRKRLDALLAKRAAYQAAHAAQTETTDEDRRTS